MSEMKNEERKDGNGWKRHRVKPLGSNAKTIQKQLNVFFSAPPIKNSRGQQRSHFCCPFEKKTERKKNISPPLVPAGLASILARPPHHACFSFRDLEHEDAKQQTFVSSFWPKGHP